MDKREAAEVAHQKAMERYEEVSARILREYERFKADTTVTLRAALLRFAESQQQYHSGLQSEFGYLRQEAENHFMYHANSLDRVLQVPLELILHTTARAELTCTCPWN